MVLALWLPVAAMAPGAVSGPLKWPSFSVAGLVSWLTGTPAPPRGPVQEMGTAAGLPHYVPAAVTRAVARAAGSVPHPGPGQLPAYAAHEPAPVGFATGPYVGDGSASFAPATSKLVPGSGTATSDLYRNADGTYTRLVYLVPVN